MKTDRELLELAAKAAGYREAGINKPYTDGLLKNWNPLTDDGDALRLAVKCQLDILPVGAFAANENKICALVQDRYDKINESVPHDGDPMAATRRAITRAAAAIGERE